MEGTLTQLVSLGLYVITSTLVFSYGKWEDRNGKKYDNLALVIWIFVSLIIPCLFLITGLFGDEITKALGESKELIASYFVIVVLNGITILLRSIKKADQETVKDHTITINWLSGVVIGVALVILGYYLLLEVQKSNDDNTVIEWRWLPKDKELTILLLALTIVNAMMNFKR